MDTLVVVLVLFGALLHAAWNALVKSSGDKELDLALVHFLGALAALPLLLLLGPPPSVVWPFLATSLLIHIAYYVTLNGAYQHGELGITYPIMRGSAPMLVALGSFTVLGESLSAAAWLGVCAVTAGVLMVGLSRPVEALHHRRALAFALANAFVIAGYTFVDGQGVRHSVTAGGSSFSYIAMLFVLDGIPYPALVVWRRNAEGRARIMAYARRRWPLATLGGLASLGSYGIALWAMTRAPVAAVSALRETSVLFATALSVLVLKERFGAQRAVGALIIVAGVVALRLS
ncbi:MAG: EamA family transporter [Rubrivivax sp.]|nr:EamA family transporter [Rubrivivax sp.]MBK7260737.1 EamA family transporter [Rubrivivax sp.]